MVEAGSKMHIINNWYFEWEWGWMSLWKRVEWGVIIKLDIPHYPKCTYKTWRVGPVMISRREGKK